MSDSIQKQRKRRQSMAIGVPSGNGVSRPIKNRDRRRTFAVPDKENVSTLNSVEQKNPPEAPPDSSSVRTSTAAFTTASTNLGKSPFQSRHRTKLPEASAFYFKGLQKAAEPEKSIDFSFDGSLNAAETSFVSRASSSSGSGDEDLLNKSTLSDTTELAPSQFVQMAASKQRLLERSKQIQAFRDPQTQQPQEAQSAFHTETEKQPVVHQSEFHAAKPPLDLENKRKTEGNRRHTVGQQVSSRLAQQQEQNDSSVGATPKDDKDKPRRESWHGPSPQDPKQQGSTLSVLRGITMKRRHFRLSGNHDDMSGRNFMGKVGSPALMENNRIVKRGIVPSPTPQVMAPNPVLGTPAAQDDEPEGRGESSNETTHAGQKQTRRDTADTRDLALFLSDCNGKSIRESADGSSFDLRSPARDIRSPARDADETADPPTTDVEPLNATNADETADTLEIQLDLSESIEPCTTTPKSPGKTLTPEESPITRPAERARPVEPCEMNSSSPLPIEKGVEATSRGSSPEPLPAARLSPERRRETGASQVSATSVHNTADASNLDLEFSFRSTVGHNVLQADDQSEPKGKSTNSPPTDSEQPAFEEMDAGNDSVNRSDETADESALDLWNESPQKSGESTDDEYISPPPSLRKTSNHPTEPVAKDDIDESDTSMLAENSGMRMVREHLKQNKLTPTKLTRSPRKVANPQSTDSPAHNTRSKVPLSQKHAEENDDVQDQQAAGTVNDSSMDLDDTMTADDALHPDTSVASILVKPGSHKKRGSRSVAFGSPQLLHYNIGSPPISATPMRFHEARQATMPEDTVEIANDMAAMEKSGEGFQAPGISHCAASHTRATTENNRHRFSQESCPDSDMDLSSLGEEQLSDFGATESPIWSGAIGDQAARTDGISRRFEEDAEGGTVSLEDNVAALLARTESPDWSGEVDGHATAERKSHGNENETKDVENKPPVADGKFRKAEEETIGLEDNVAILLAQTESPARVDDQPMADPKFHNLDDDSNILKDKFSNGGSPTMAESTLRKAEEETIGLEDNVAILLAQTESPGVSDDDHTATEAEAKSKKSEQVTGVLLKRKSEAVDGGDEDTARLEIDMEQVLDGVDPEHGYSKRRRFSLMPNARPDLPMEVSRDESAAGDEEEDNLRAEVQNERFLKQSDIPGTKLPKTPEDEPNDNGIDESATDPDQNEEKNMLLQQATSLVDSIVVERTKIRNDQDLVDKSKRALKAKSAQRARLRSLERRKADVQSRREELERVGERLDAAKKRHQETASTKESLVTIRSQSLRRTNIRAKLPILRGEGEQSEKKFTLQKQISAWELTEVNEQRTSLSYRGPCSESCAVVTFSFGHDGDLVCNMTPSCLNPLSGRRLPREVAEYWGKRNQAFCLTASTAEQNLVSLKKKMRESAWNRCKLEAICSELAMLHRRYDLSMTSQAREGGGTVCCVDVKFCRATSHVELLASFEFGDAYPYSDMKMQVKGDTAFDLQKLRLLAKSAKRGFGRLSRTIDIVGAYYNQVVAAQKSGDGVF